MRRCGPWFVVAPEVNGGSCRDREGSSDVAGEIRRGGDRCRLRRHVHAAQAAPEGLQCACLRDRQGRRRHVVLEPLSRARAATSRACEYSYSVRRIELQQEWQWTERYRGAAGDPAIRQSTSRTASISGRTSASTRSVVARRGSTRWRIRWTDPRRIREARRVGRDLPRDGDRLPLVGRTSPKIEGIESTSKGVIYAHRQRWPHEGVDLTREAPSAWSAPARRRVQAIPVIAEQAAAARRSSSGPPNYSDSRERNQTLIGRGLPARDQGPLLRFPGGECAFAPAGCSGRTFRAQVRPGLGDSRRRTRRNERESYEERWADRRVRVPLRLRRLPEEPRGRTRRPSDVRQTSARCAKP